MDPRHKIDLERVGAESRSIVNGTRRTCEDAQAHIRASRESVGRSFDLLRRRFLKLHD